MAIVYNKLVRDKIPQIIESAGKKALTRVAEPEEYLELLKVKLNEEVIEFHESDDSEELADILEVLISLSEAQGISWSEIEAIALKKREERGGFKERIILVEVQE